ncbi:MAG: ATP-binding cassette domain-containing protein [Lachnospiraceae bacterium]|nr:ATP-binding cassette domain-containing protein [Lachnospiraceae bacterium]
MRDVVIKTHNLTKKYGSFTALENANMTIYQGDIYGLIGRNGAGKTTAMKILTGLTDQTDGDYEIFGKASKDSASIRRRVGCLIENPAFFENMTAYQNLRYYCYQKGIADLSKIDEVLDFVNLQDAKNKKFKTFSLGMKQRLGIAFAIMDNPDLVVLDEPINGLDPIGIAELRDTFHMLAHERGMTLMISSHILSELYALANRFLIIDHGRVLKEISKEELDNECSRATVLRVNDVKGTCVILERDHQIKNFKVIDDGEIRIYDEHLQTAGLNRSLVQSGIEVSQIFETGISLEEYFKKVIEEEER